MDLRAYYQKIREVEETIAGEFAVVVSEKTPDGGRAGVLTEVTRFVGARMIAEQRARLATPEETQALRQHQADLARQAAQEEASKRMQITVLSDAELRQLREKFAPRKG